MRRPKTFTALALAFGLVACSSNPPPTSCSDSVTFRLEAPKGSTWYFASSEDTVDENWISVTTSAGVNFPITLYATDPNDGQYCGQGGVILYSGGTISEALPDGGTSETWNGLAYIPGHGCVTPTCAPSSHYVAKMCACRSIACFSGGSTFTCVSVPFDYPASAPVVGTLPKD